MTTVIRKSLFWTPRILCIFFAAFLTIFSLDVFEGGYGFWGTVLGLLMHNIPTFFLVAVIIFTWRYEWVGGIIFIALAIFYIVMFWGRFPLITYVMISGPLIVIGILYFLNWKYRAELRPIVKPPAADVEKP